MSRTAEMFASKVENRIFSVAPSLFSSGTEWHVKWLPTQHAFINSYVLSWRLADQSVLAVYLGTERRARRSGACGRRLQPASVAGATFPTLSWRPNTNHTDAPLPRTRNQCFLEFMNHFQEFVRTRYYIRQLENQPCDVSPCVFFEEKWFSMMNSTL